MKDMKIGVLIAVALIFVVAFWTINSVRSRQYSGSDISLTVGSGSVIVTNLSSETIPVEMRSDGRSSNFRVESAKINLRASSRSQGGGRTAYHLVSFELPTGQTTIKVTRGSNVVLVSKSDARIEATVFPMSTTRVQWTLGIATLIVLGALRYISGQYEHQWIGIIRAKLPVNKVPMRRNAA